MSIFTTRSAITAGAVAVAVVMSIGGVAVAQAAIDDRLEGVTPTSIPSPNSSNSSSDDGPLHDLNDDNGGDRPDGVSDDGPLHDLNDDNGGDDDLSSDDSDSDDSDNSGPGSGDDDSDNSGHGNSGHDSDDDSDDDDNSGSSNN